MGVLVASAVFLLMSVVADPKDAFFTLMMVALSYPVYFFAVVKSRRVPHPFPVINPTDP